MNKNSSNDKSIAPTSSLNLTTAKSDLIARGLSLINNLPFTKKLVLIVDDDKEWLLSMTDGLIKYNESFSSITAFGGEHAFDLLKKYPISLVVTDLKMPQINGFAVISYVKSNYPEIPVIMMTAGYSPENAQRAYKLGAKEFIAKPFIVDDLAILIIKYLRKQSEGGTLRGVSRRMFLELIEVEQKSCTIRLNDKISNQYGVLFFKDGILMDARTNTLRGKSAAVEIFSWDNVTLSIQNDYHVQENKIQCELQTLLLEAMQIKGKNIKKGQKAETIIEDKKSDDAMAHNNLGAAYVNSGRYQEAVEAYKQAIQLKPDYADAHVNLGSAYRKSGRHQEAIEAYKQAIKVKPDYAKAHNNLGYAYGELGRWQEAIEAYKQAIQLEPDHAGAYYNLGAAYKNLGRYQEMIEAYKQAIRLKPDYVGAHNNLGYAYGELGRWQEAIEAYKQAIKIKPDLAEAHSNLGFTYLKIGDKVSALKEYKILKTFDLKSADQLFNEIYK